MARHGVAHSGTTYSVLRSARSGICITWFWTHSAVPPCANKNHTHLPDGMKALSSLSAAVLTTWELCRGFVTLSLLLTCNRPTSRSRTCESVPATKSGHDHVPRVCGVAIERLRSVSPRCVDTTCLRLFCVDVDFGKAHNTHCLTLFLSPHPLILFLWQARITVTAQAPFSKRYLKYLTKKYLKKQQLRDYLHVIASTKNTYELRYFSIVNDQQEADEE